MNPFRSAIHWYFSKKALPYWSVLLFDSFVLFVSGFVAYWLFYRGAKMQQHAYTLANTMVIYVVLSWIGMRLFSTYSGIIRYSSFVDLRRVTYANAFSLALAFAVHYIILYYGPAEYFEHLPGRVILVAFVIATLIMYGTRVVIKSLFDITTTDSKAPRALIYGTMSGAVSLAKSLRFQDPIRFVLKGFITNLFFALISSNFVG